MAKKDAKNESKDQKMNPQTIMLVTGVLLVGWAAGFLVGVTRDDDSASSSNVSVEENVKVHSHGEYELDESSEDLPEVSLLAEKDAKSGWNLTLITPNFEFAPQSVNEEEVEGEGHAHLWINGEKTTRLYSDYYFLDGLPEGEHTITVTLNTNKHNDYTVGGEVIMDSVDIDQGPEKEMSHEHDDDGEAENDSHSN